MTQLESSGSYRKLACFVVLVALVLFAAQANDFIHGESRYSTLSQIYASSSGFLKTSSSTEDSQTPITATLDVNSRRVDLQSNNKSYALMTDDKIGRQWLVQKRTLEEYEIEIHDFADRVYGAKNKSSQLDILNSIGLPAVLEMEDGREFTCLLQFYSKWRRSKPFSGESFFDWLDYGSGKYVVTELCNRGRLNRRRYGMLNETEIEASRVHFRVAFRRTKNHHHQRSLDGKVVQAVFVASQQPVEEGLWLSVWDLDQHLHLIQGGRFPADDQPFHYFKRGHGSVTKGKPVLYAGEMGIGKQGLVQFTNPESGHYRPHSQHTLAFYHWMHSQVGDVARASIDWRPYNNASNSTLKTWKTLFQ